MMHTIVPLEMIFSGIKRKFSGKKLTTMNINGVLLEGEKRGDYFKIHRIISSDPALYLQDTKYAIKMSNAKRVPVESKYKHN